MRFAPSCENGQCSGIEFKEGKPQFCSFFATQPDVKAKYFPEMTGDEQMGNHGVRVLNAVGAMVKHCKNEDDEKLVKKIHEVYKELDLIPDCIFHVAKSH